MHSLRPLLASVVISFLLCAAPNASADVIYDDTTTRIGSDATVTAEQLGSEVNAAGTARYVTDLLVGVAQKMMEGNVPFVPETANLQVWLYANDGAGGKPGSLLWTGPLMTNVTLSSGPNLIDFPVPFVLVPDTFTWTMQVSGASPSPAGLPTFSPPTVGSSPASWIGDGSNWSLEPGGPFEARVIAISGPTGPGAVPEPTSLLLVLSGASLLLWRRTAWGQLGQRRAEGTPLP